jgi:diguanylate cyclase (GGDEF)-like protein
MLIAEDEPVSRRLLENTLVRLGHEVIAVADGTSALTELLRPGAPTLAILDWMMPGADGITVCRALRQRPTPYVYVIMLTARHDREANAIAVEAEVDDFLRKPFDAIELAARLRTGERVLALQDGLLRAHEKLRQQATHDHLTGLWNRSMVLEQITLELGRAAREARPTSIVMADLDHFKRINDTYGHAAGDVALLQAAQRMRSRLRPYDGMGRYGGEEFLLLLPGCDVPAARDIADRARAAVAGSPIAVESGVVPITVSMGIASSPDGGTDAASMIAAADDALYRAKAEGRNRVAA